MATTPLKSKQAFNFATTSDSNDAQYARQEMERLSQYLIGLINDVQDSVTKLGAGSSTNYSKAIESINKQISNIFLAIGSIPKIDTNSFVNKDVQNIVQQEITKLNK